MKPVFPLLQVAGAAQDVAAGTRQVVQGATESVTHAAQAAGAATAEVRCAWLVFECIIVCCSASTCHKMSHIDLSPHPTQ